MNENFLHQAAKASAELFHSNMLAFLWQRYPDVANLHLGCGIPADTFVRTSDIAREKHHVDLLVIAGDYVIAIENKFKSRHTAEQLKKYEHKLAAAYPHRQLILVALCTTVVDATETKARIGQVVNAKYISYEEHVIPFVRELVARAEAEKDARSLFYLGDYLEVIEDLLTLVRKHEAASFTLGQALDRISKDENVSRFKLAPLLQRRLFENVLLRLTKRLASAEVAAPDHGYKFDDIGLGSQSKQGLITASLAIPVMHTSYLIRMGLQLEGRQLRRFLTFEKPSRSSLDESDKNVIHRIATDFARNDLFFADTLGEATTPSKPRHFKATGKLDAFLAFRNSSSVFFLYLDLAVDCGALSLDAVAERLSQELARLEARHRSLVARLGTESASLRRSALVNAVSVMQ